VRGSGARFGREVLSRNLVLRSQGPLVRSTRGYRATRAEILRQSETTLRMMELNDGR
jgi:hypothetical protein